MSEEENGLALNSQEKLEYKFHDLSYRTAAIRSLLISEFEIFDNMKYANIQKADLNDICDLKKRAKVIKQNPDQPCLFNTLQRYMKEKSLTVEERKLARKKARGIIPISAFANFMINSISFINLDSAFKIFMNLIVVLDVICIALFAEYQNTSSSFLYYDTVFSNIIILFYVAELILKASDSRKAMWKNSWDVFNMGITVFTASLEIIILFLNERGFSKNPMLEQIRLIKVVRILKLVANVSNLKVIIKTISVAFKPMMYIGVLMLMGLGLFAIIGVSLFGSEPELKNTLYAYRFSSLGSCIALLFQLMTLDNWTDSYLELIEIVNPFIVTVFFVLWICLGAFVFKNVFIGVLVNNFARVDDELREQRVKQKNNSQLGKMKQKLQGELKKVQNRLEKSGSSAILQPKQIHIRKQGSLLLPNSVTSKPTSLVFPSKTELNEWDNIVHETRAAILTQDTQIKWNKKLAFKYLQLLSSLQEDLEEYYEINKLAVQIILEILQE
eukprot:NODE_302_length_11399_cov_0.339115.p2 type:complete len:500 gc:universal NODE_302_length_11399_cov_0.339115:1582-3081(+)